MDLHSRITALEAELARLREQAKDEALQIPNPEESTESPESSKTSEPTSIEYHESQSDSLSLHEYRRYGRQMIVPGFGSLPSQIALKKAAVLVIGAGGLGCPALLYLCGAGIGTLGIVDNDTVDVSNLHRQVLHTTDSVDMLKCDSAKRQLQKLNPNVNIVTHPLRLSNDNAFGVISQYDVVVDCTDTPQTRYLINDVSVLLGKTVVSGSGVKTDGQITILNYATTGPCYRCFYPTAPKPESVSTCSDAGVFGPAIGLTGISLATETIKVLTNFYGDAFSPFLAMYSAFPQQSMRSFKMRRRQPQCAVCGDHPTISRELIESGAIDYAAFCGKISYNVIPESLRTTVHELKEKLAAGPLLLDVRPKDQFEITHLPNSVNVDWDRQLSKLDSIDSLLPADFDKNQNEIYVICRYGNDSQLAVRRLTQELGFKKAYDVKGGLNKWSSEIDPNVPIY